MKRQHRVLLTIGLLIFIAALILFSCRMWYLVNYTCRGSEVTSDERWVMSENLHFFHLQLGVVPIYTMNMTRERMSFTNATLFVVPLIKYVERHKLAGRGYINANDSLLMQFAAALAVRGGNEELAWAILDKLKKNDSDMSEHYEYRIDACQAFLNGDTSQQSIVHSLAREYKSRYKTYITNQADCYRPE
ncbi:MAG: hypothetical protein R6V03_00375 [Kiritimatiellia bacterium]